MAATYAVAIIGDVEKEPERMKTLQTLIDYYHVLPFRACYGDDARSDPLYPKFTKNYNINPVSLTINHLELMRRHVDLGTFLVVFESDAMPKYAMDEVHAGIQNDIQAMQAHGIEFAFIGTGCLVSEPTTYNDPANRVGDTLYFARRLHANGESRCSEAYIVSPKGMKSFLAWFLSTTDHGAIDWAFNHYFRQNPSALGCWRHPELFSQGTCDGTYKSTIAR